MYMKEEQILDDLVLVLMYTYSWKQKITDKLFVTRSWKGYDYDTIDRLAMKGYVYSSHTAKSVTITEEGLKRAIILKKMLFDNIEKLYESV